MIHKETPSKPTRTLKYQKGTNKYQLQGKRRRTPNRKNKRKNNQPKKRKEKRNRSSLKQKQCRTRTWKSTFTLIPLLEEYYGDFFDRNCSQYLHCLDAVKDGICLIDDKPRNIGYIALYKDVFNPVGMHA